MVEPTPKPETKKRKMQLKRLQSPNTPTPILAPFILGNRNIKSRIRGFDWLFESLESSVVIGCFF